MKALKTIYLAAIGILAFGAASCNKDKDNTSTDSPEATSVLDSIMEVTAQGEVAQLDTDNQLKSDTEVETTTVVCFVAEDAPTCAPLKEPLEKLASENEGSVAVITVDVLACPITAADFGLDPDTPLVPCVAVLTPGEDVVLYTGLDNFLPSDMANKPVEVQAETIYANLLNYAGLTETE